MNIVITSGGTNEKIDGVRNITNMSTGKLGSIIAETLLKDNFNKVFYICSKKTIIPENNIYNNLEIIYSENVEDLLNNINYILTNNKIDWFVHSMAVSDYKVKNVITKTEIFNYFFNNLNLNNNIEEIKKLFNESFENVNDYSKDNKIDSKYEDFIISLEKTEKIVDKIKIISPDTKLISFKLLNNSSENILIEKSKNQLKRTNSEYVIGNDLKNINNEFHKAFILNKNGDLKFCNTKSEIADKIKFIIND